MSREAALVERLLDIVEVEILPRTRKGVADGNKIFGAAILRKSDWSLVLAETNNETENPLWHGEVHAIKRFYELPRSARPAPRELIFLATHEPCSLCLSAITWAGYDNFYYLFSHEDSRDAFAIPHDLDILKQVFNVDPGAYNASNAYWTSHSIGSMIQTMPPAARALTQARVGRIAESYERLSADYQRSKAANGIPLP